MIHFAALAFVVPLRWRRSYWLATKRWWVGWFPARAAFDHRGAQHAHLHLRYLDGGVMDHLGGAVAVVLWWQVGAVFGHCGAQQRHLPVRYLIGCRGAAGGER